MRTKYMEYKEEGMNLSFVCSTNQRKSVQRKDIKKKEREEYNFITTPTKKKIEVIREFF